MWFSPLMLRPVCFSCTYSPTSVRTLSSSLLPILCESLILCPSHGLWLSPNFIDSLHGALRRIPSPEFHSAWSISIRRRARHEQKSHCDQACSQLPMSLLALAVPAAWLSHRIKNGMMWMNQVRVEGMGDDWWITDTCATSWNKKKFPPYFFVHYILVEKNINVMI